MLIRNSLVWLLLWLSACSAYADGIIGGYGDVGTDGIADQFSDGTTSKNIRSPVNPPPPPFLIPTVQFLTCNISLPVTTGVAVTPACTYTALCSGIACSGGNAVTSWAISTPTCINCFAVDPLVLGRVTGGVNAAAVANNATYTAIVTATNATGTSPPVSQTITVGAPVAPVVVATTCTLTSLPIAIGGATGCAFTATCSGGACASGNVITSWAITTQSCAGCFVIDNMGNLQGGANAASIVAPGTYTVTLTATNATGTSAPIPETISAPAVLACNGVLDLSTGCIIPGVGP